MSRAIEQRLRRALEQQAAATVVAPDGWERLRGRIRDRGDDRRRRIVQWGVLAPAAAVAVVALLVLVRADNGGDDELRVAGDSGQLFLVPTGVDGRFRPVAADDDLPFPRPPEATTRAFGHRAGDRFALEASVVIRVPADPEVVGAVPEPEPLPVFGRGVPVARDHFGQRILSWPQADGQTVEVATYGLTQADLVRLAESLLAGDARSAEPALPPGFSPVDSAARDTGSTSVQTWEADDGTRFEVSIAEVTGATLDDVAVWLPGGRAVKVRGTTGVFSDRHGGDLVWLEQGRAAVTVHGTGLSEPELMAIAEGLRPVGTREWRELVDRARGLRDDSLVSGLPFRADTPPPDPPRERRTGRPLTSANAFLLIRPVKARLAPPCPGSESGPLAPVVVETVGGRDAACYSLGPPLFDAESVAAATARPDPASGRWAVELTPTADGVARLAALSRESTSGQVAVLVDGELVAVPDLAQGSRAGAVVVTGLDERTARRLAERLQR